ncbi:CesT family type III secretion system chaperone [Aquabacterium sp. A7-Y]|uniref:CesT family type III secretion system chaperone n=1 Tax=Aquabacterium sp. A7-Y TaxID=1349605 RepID=UPI00223D3686|nr:CesT family type III secretion system chaperone [Aquabacterium sp. A7-Y]MCW7536965.1 CesT family type III secretion system chaperone [Aquabacterium sp. A7-Y]
MPAHWPGGAPAIAAGRVFQADGVNCALIHSAEPDPAGFFCWIELGRPNDLDQSAIHLRLLQANFETGGGRGAGFALSPITGTLVHVAQMRLAVVTPERLAQHIVKLARFANGWREAQRWQLAAAPR